MKRSRSCFARMAVCGAAVLALGFLDGVLSGQSVAVSAVGLGICLGIAALGLVEETRS